MEKIKLFCFPYAGGSSTVFYKWKMYLDSRIELIPIEFAGRGKRIDEPFYENISEAVNDIYKEIVSYVESSKFSFFGHSMGSVLVYELYKKIAKETRKEPIHVFVSGRYPPHIEKKQKKFHSLPDNEFKDEIIKIGGTPKDVFDNKEFAQIFIPILRSDYKLIERYKYNEDKILLNCGITVLNGRSDKLSSKDELLEWRRYTNNDCIFYEFEGDHFFIHNKTREITDIINKTIEACF